MKRIAFIGGAELSRGTPQQRTLVDLVLSHTGYQATVLGQPGTRTQQEILSLFAEAAEKRSDIIVFWPPTRQTADLQAWQHCQDQLIDWQQQHRAASYINLLDVNDPYPRPWPGQQDREIRSLWLSERRLAVSWAEWPNALSYVGNVKAAQLLLTMINGVI